jgi:hypothetical protein
MTDKSKITVSVGEYVFSSNFDSGSLHNVKLTSRDNFDLWVAPDCAGTEYEKLAYRTWFYFSVAGGSLGRRITCTIRNMNNKDNLFRKGMAAVARALPSRPDWIRMPTSYQILDDGKPKPDSMEMTFTYIFQTDSTELVYFAYYIPYSYEDLQDRLRKLDELPPDNTIYYHRELLVRSVDDHRVDLLTITAAPDPQELSVLSHEDVFTIPIPAVERDAKRRQADHKEGKDIWCWNPCSDGKTAIRFDAKPCV